MEDRMEQEQKTVVGVFDDYESAQQAARELESAGVPRAQIQVESNLKTGAAGYGGAATEEHHGGGIRGFFHRLFGGDDEEHGHYQESLRRGNSIVAVTAEPDQIDRIARIMNDLGAVDIDRRANYYRQTGYSGYDENSPAYTSEEAKLDRERFREHASGTAVPVIEEELQVGKRAVQRGGVRVYSRVVDQPVEEQVNLRQERVSVERRPANRPVERGDLSRLEDQTIEVTETVEEPVVSKRAVVREEVVVGKEATERTETIRDNVRRTEVRVEPIPGSGAEIRGESETSPAYAYGSRAAGDPRFTGRSWDEAENDLRVDYMRNNPTSRWDEAKADIRRGWYKITGRR
jgi:uncharacterized protein (TIGR02271 family)